MKPSVPLLALFAACALHPALAAEKKAAPAPPAATVAAAPTEAIDYSMYQRIRDEGLNHSHVMEYASALADDIGPRLTGSPNLAKANAWTRDQLTAMGCTNAHLEDWGDFGMGWQQLNTWLRMTAPDTAVFVAQASPWSPPTMVNGQQGPVTAEAVHLNPEDDAALAKYKGKLAGKIIFLGDMRPVPPITKPLWTRYTDEQLAEEQSFEFPDRPGAGPTREERIQRYLKRQAFQRRLSTFLADEHIAGVVLPSRDMDNGGGTGIIADDNGTWIVETPYKPDHKMPFPVAVAAIENWGRVYRLLRAHVPVSVELNIDTRFTGDHEHAYNTIAEIPGTDPTLKAQVVMVGGHLDSWISGTGAADNGAGAVVAMEVMRILNALHVQPRRTIRIGLWTGEEQGEYGSVGYVKQHFGWYPPSTDPAQLALPEFIRQPGGPLELKPEHKLLAAYFNVDNGSGRIRGVYLENSPAVEPIFAAWIKPLEDLGVTTLSYRHTGGTDHESFQAVGLPGFQFIQDPLDYDTRTHHTNMDTFEHLDPNDLKQAATVEAIFVYNAAMRDEMLPRPPLPEHYRDTERSAPLPNVFPGATPETK